MTLAQLSITVALLGGLGLVASRVGLSAIPAYLLAGLLLGPNEPKALSIVQPSEVTDFVAEIGIDLPALLPRPRVHARPNRPQPRHVFYGGSDRRGREWRARARSSASPRSGSASAAFILAAAIYVSSSAITVKGLIDFRRLADDETDLVLAILVAEDIVIAVVLGFAAGGGGEATHTLAIVAKAIGFIAAALAISKWLSGPIDRFLDRLPREIFLLAAFAFLVGSAALAQELGLSEAIGALMAGVVLSEHLDPRGDRGALLQLPRRLRGAVLLRLRPLHRRRQGRQRGLAARRSPSSLTPRRQDRRRATWPASLGGYSRRQSLNVGVALVAHGEFTIILAQLASGNARISDATQVEASSRSRGCTC